MISDRTIKADEGGHLPPSWRCIAATPEQLTNRRHRSVICPIGGCRSEIRRSYEDRDRFSVRVSCGITTREPSLRSVQAGGVFFCPHVITR